MSKIFLTYAEFDKVLPSKRTHYLDFTQRGHKGWLIERNPFNLHWLNTETEDWAWEMCP